MSPVKQYRPTTPARRHASVVVTPRAARLKRLSKGGGERAGRARSGQITVRHRGGGAKRLFREVDFRQSKEVPSTVDHLAYDPYRTAFIALLKYTDGDQRYVLAEARMKAGQKIEVGSKAALQRGNRVPLSRIPTGSDIYNIQLHPDSVGTLVRSAGSSASVTAQEEGGQTQIKLPSGEVRRLPGNCLATLGAVSNPDHENIRIGKAGRNRHRGIRPHVRGKAMNPTDHPHGGGEGGSPIGLKGPKTPSGLYTLGRKTRRRKVPRSVVRSR